MSTSFDRSSVSISLIETETLIKQKEEAIANLEIQLELQKKVAEKLEFEKEQELNRMRRESENAKQTVADLTELIRTNSKSTNSLETDKLLYKLQMENNNLRKEVHLLKKRSKNKASSGRDVIEDVLGAETDPNKTVNLGPPKSSKQQENTGRRQTADLEKKEPAEADPQTLATQQTLSIKTSDNSNNINTGSMIRQIEEQLREEQEKYARLEAEYQRILAEYTRSKTSISQTSHFYQDNEREMEKLIHELDERGRTIFNLSEALQKERHENKQLKDDVERNRQVIKDYETKTADLTVTLKEVNQRMGETNKNYFKLLETYNTESTELKEKLSVYDKRTIQLQMETDKLKFENQNYVEKIKEYLEKIEFYQNSKNAEAYELRENYQRESTALNLKITQLMKEMRDNELEKKHLMDENFNLKLKIGDVVDSFRILGNVPQSDGEGEVSKQEGKCTVEPKRPSNTVDFETMSYESLQMDKKSKNDHEFLLNDFNERGLSVEQQPVRDNVSKKSRTGAILPIKDGQLASRLISQQKVNKSRFVDNQYMSNFSQNVPQVRTSVIKSFRDQPLNRSKVLNSIETKHLGQSVHDISQIISKNLDPENLTDVMRDMDDPVLQYIEELNEKNKEIMELKEELNRLTKSEGVEALKSEVAALQIKLKELETAAADKEEERLKERQFHQRNYDDLCELLVKQKLKASALIVERDTLWAKMSKKIKQLTYKVQIYEEQIKELNDS